MAEVSEVTESTFPFGDNEVKVLGTGQRVYEVQLCDSVEGYDESAIRTGRGIRGPRMRELMQFSKAVRRWTIEENGVTVFEPRADHYAFRVALGMKKVKNDDGSIKWEACSTMMSNRCRYTLQKVKNDAQLELHAKGCDGCKRATVSASGGASRAVSLTSMFEAQVQLQGQVRADACTAASLLVSKGLPIAQVPLVLSRSSEEATLLGHVIEQGSCPTSVNSVKKMLVEAAAAMKKAYRDKIAGYPFALLFDDSEIEGLGHVTLVYVKSLALHTVSLFFVFVFQGIAFK